MGTLMVTEKARLKECERTIERGMATFVEVGKALAEIRDSRLYRDTHGTFAAYVRQRWGRTRDWAYKVIESSSAALNVDRGIHPLPTVERQARELAKAPPERQSEVWEAASEDGKPTAAKVRAAVDELCEPARRASQVDRAFTEKTPFEQLSYWWERADAAARTRFRLWIDGECS